MTSFVSLLASDSRRVWFAIALMALIALVELAIPQRPRNRAHRDHWLPNLALTCMALATNIVLNVAITLVLLFLESRDSGLLAMLSLPAWLNTLLVVVLLDFAFYLAHVAMHHVPIFWRFHRVHHSDAALDVTTSIRQHPLEGLIRCGFTGTAALAIGASAHAFAVYRLLSLINALLEHANLRVNPRLDRALSWLVVTPTVHKVHHSRAPHETNSNYGNILSVFDRTLATFTPTERSAHVVYGLDGFDERAQQSTIGLLRSPFQTSGMTAISRPTTQRVESTAP